MRSCTTSHTTKRGPTSTERSAEDALSTGALVAFSYSAIASVKGFDDLYPKLLGLVTEISVAMLVFGEGEDSGISKAKRVLNALHREMVLGGYEEGHSASRE